MGRQGNRLQMKEQENPAEEELNGRETRNLPSFYIRKEKLCIILCNLFRWDATSSYQQNSNFYLILHLK